MRHISRLLIVASIMALQAACGDDGGGGGTGGAGGGAGGGPGAGGSGGGSGGAGGVDSGPPQAPVMTSVTPLQGVLHVEWENVTPDCDTIELDRNLDGGAFMTAYTLTGAATSQHDTEAVPPGMYCYKARCTKGDLVSPDSNELCGTP